MITKTYLLLKIKNCVLFWQCFFSQGFFRIKTSGSTCFPWGYQLIRRSRQVLNKKIGLIESIGNIQLHMALSAVA